MDINKIQKLNSLAHSLQRHNIGFSQDDAIAQAENIYGIEHSYAREAITMENNEFDEMRKDVRRMSFALRDAVVEINNLKSQVTKLEKELNDARVGQMPPRRAEAPAEAKFSSPEARFEAKKDANKPIDRNGIAPSDIAIEKFFYYGQK